VLIETTSLPFAGIAFASGFSSVRQFNDTIRQVFASSPTDLRRMHRRGDRETSGRLTLRLAVRQPYDRDGVVRWLAARAVEGVEDLSEGVYRRTLRLPAGIGMVALAPRDDHVLATFALGEVTDIAAVHRCRQLLDLDADPRTYTSVLGDDAALAPLVEANPGLRAAGTVDAAETAIRAVLGQQVSLGAARTLAARLVALAGEPLEQPDGSLTHAFPTSEAIAAADLAAIGMPAQRRRTLSAIAGRLAAGSLVLDAGADRDEVSRQLLDVPGVGPWTASYIALRALHDPDAFPAGDLGLRKSARALGIPDDERGLASRAEPWRPWRAYAAHYLWAAHP
jgi:AraC family transcriptional regulator, regulatory protein of adaptative response / DNA-3-methyladenine glycosylase II